MVPGEWVIRDCLIRIEPGVMQRALDAWNQAWGKPQSALVIDGKVVTDASIEARA